ncbi:flagellar export protein FliJ [Lentibacillus persicus]|nr:flagellar export protein FliJ [Lentibacillus persicus]
MGTAALEKVLHIRENEKTQAQKAYHKSIEQFEEVGTQLYDILRKKETAETAYETYLKQTAPIQKIREQATFIEHLNKQILKLQKDVQQARDVMNAKHAYLSETYIEMKKYEKIIEHRQAEKDAKARKIEKDTMDEISIRQFMDKKTGEQHGSEINK